MDYGKIGFKCGLEIHQQLSGKKLFCDCPAINSDKKPDVRIKRELRAVAGETGIVDAAAKHEMKKHRTYIYVGNTEDTCLVEFDEEPAHPMNKEALTTAVVVSQLLNAKIVDDIQVMRKTVVDGSNVSGFQRTALVGYGGYIDTSLGKVRISSICIEEEAAQKLKQEKDFVTYKLDRLGITLIEIATDVDVKTPEHAKECAEKLGMILRSTGKVRRGLGTIRQDVNISIKGGARTEIKGFQDLKSIPKVIEKEIKRQQELIKKDKKISMEVRKAEPDFSTTFLRPMPGSARMYPETDVCSVKPEIKTVKIELLSDKARRFEKQFKLSADIAMKLVKSETSDDFEIFARKYKKLKPAYLIELLLGYKKELLRDFKPCEPSKISKKHIEIVLSALNNSEISKDSVINILADVAKGNALDLNRYKMTSVDDIEKEIKKIIKKNKGAPIGALMGEVMKKYRGKVDGKKINELIRKLI